MQLDMFGKYEEKLQTDKIVDKILKGGSNFEGGKERIKAIVKDDSLTKSQKVEYIKQEYGVGGGSEEYAYRRHDAQGKTITIKETGEIIELSWAEVLDRVSRYIENNEY